MEKGQTLLKWCTHWYTKTQKQATCKMSSQKANHTNNPFPCISGPDSNLLHQGIKNWVLTDLPGSLRDCCMVSRTAFLVSVLYKPVSSIHFTSASIIPTSLSTLKSVLYTYTHTVVADFQHIWLFELSMIILLQKVKNNTTIAKSGVLRLEMYRYGISPIIQQQVLV